MSRKLIFIFCLFFCIYLGANLFSSLRKYMEAKKEIREAEQNLSNLEEKNRQLQERLKEVKSPEFIEKEAREKLGLAKPGETVYILPPNVAYLPRQEENIPKEELPNWQKWWKLFF